MRNRNDATNVDTGTNLSQKLGIPNGNLGDLWTSGLAEVFVNGYDTPLIGVNGCLPWRRSTTNFEIANNWTKTKGNHVINWGFDGRYEKYFLLQTATFSPRGRFTFTPGPTTLNAPVRSEQFRQLLSPSFRAGPAQRDRPRSGRNRTDPPRQSLRLILPR